MKDDLYEIGILNSIESVTPYDALSSQIPLAKGVCQPHDIVYRLQQPFGDIL
jgi:hypothetical protein